MKGFFSIIFALSIVVLSACSGTGVKYYTDLEFNHNSPWFPIVGTHEISAEAAQSLDHYVFYFNAQGKIEKIINNFGLRKKKPSHQLTHLDGVKTVRYSYEGNIETREFFDAQDKPCKNMKWVNKEKYAYGNDGKLAKLEFLDLENKAMESMWGISRYEWTKHGDMIIERRYNLQNTSLPIAPYFPMGQITGLVVDSKGRPHETRNLDENYKLIPGIGDLAYYFDEYDENNFHKAWSYHKVDGGLTGAYGFARGEVTYDDNGYAATEERFDLEGKSIRKETF